MNVSPKRGRKPISIFPRLPGEDTNAWLRRRRKEDPVYLAHERAQTAKRQPSEKGKMREMLAEQERLIASLRQENAVLRSTISRLVLYRK